MFVCALPPSFVERDFFFSIILSCFHLSKVFADLIRQKSLHRFYLINLTISSTKDPQLSNISCGFPEYMYATHDTTLFSSSTTALIPGASIGTWVAPIDSAAGIAHECGKSSPASQPIVIFTPSGKDFAANTGAIHENPMGFLEAWNDLMMASTVGSTSISLPLTAKLHKFFATPNPPGKTRAS